MTILRIMTRLNIKPSGLTQTRSGRLKIFNQRPWNSRFSSKVRVAREVADDPESPFVRVDDPIPFDKKVLEVPSIPHWFYACVAKYGDAKSFGTRSILSEYEEKQPDGQVQKKVRQADDYSFISYNQVEEKVSRIVNGLVASGLKSGDKIVLFSETRVEWILSAFAAWRIGAIAVTMYANLGLEGISYILNQTKATHMIVSPNCLDKLSQLEDGLDHLQTIFCVSGPSDSSSVIPTSLKRAKVIPFDEIYHMGTDSNLAYPKPEDTSIIMYTSGSTGVPKGVILSHSNVISSMAAIITSFVAAYKQTDHEVYLAYLPQAHIFEMGVEILMFTVGIPIAFSSPFTMLDTSPLIQAGSKGDISVVKPTTMPAVPLVLDRIKKAIEEKVSSSSIVKRNLFHSSLAYKKFLYQLGVDNSIIDKIVFGKVRDVLGGQMRMMFVGGAPLSVETQQFILSTMGIILIQGYGATEIASCGSFMSIYDRTLGNCGPQAHGTKFALSNWPEAGYLNTDKPNPRGELVIGGPVVSSSYYMNEEETAKSFYVDANGINWWRSGDIAEITEEGCVKIIDRKKDLVKLQNGEYISLGKVESVLKNSPFIDNICVYGDPFHNYLIALVLPERKSFMKLAESLGKGGMDYVSLCMDHEIVQNVLETLRDFGMGKGLSKTELPQRIKLCSDEWTPDNGLVTAALKIRRLQIKSFYQSSIDSLYGKS